MKNQIAVEPLLTRKDVMRMLQVSLPTVIRLEAHGKLPALRLGAGSVRYRREDVQKFIAASAGNEAQA